MTMMMMQPVGGSLEAVLIRCDSLSLRSDAYLLYLIFASRCINTHGFTSGHMHQLDRDVRFSRTLQPSERLLPSPPAVVPAG